MSTRIYIVTETQTGIKKIVQGAATQAQAVHHVAKGLLQVAIAKPNDVLALMKAGVQIVDASSNKQMDIEEVAA